MKRLTPAQVRALPDDEAAAYLRLVEEYDASLEANPLQGYHPHAKQHAFHKALTKIKAFFGGNRSGKTTAGIVDDLIQACDRDALPEHLRQYKKWEPPFRCRIVGPSFVEGIEAVLFETIQRWVPKDQLFGGSWDSAYSKKNRKLHFANGSFFEFLSYDQELNKFGGTSRHRVHYDEEPPRAIRKECQARLIDVGGDELFTMTPLEGMTWTFDEVYELRHEAHVTVIEVATDDNAHNLDMETMELFFSSLSEEEREARRKGRFVHFGGLVLGKFDEDKLIVDPLIPSEPDEAGKRKTAPALEGQEVYVGIDPGIVRGGVVWCAFDRDNDMLVFDELYPHNLTVEVICAEIHRRNRYWGVKPLYIVDPSARNRQFNSGESTLTELIRCGINAQPGNNDRRAGVMQLRRRIEKYKIHVTRNCAMWIKERARWRVVEDEESSEDKPVTATGEGDSFKTAGPDHLMDPTRYVAMQRAWGWVADPVKPRRNKPAFQPNFEPAYNPNNYPLQNVPPMGPMS